MSWVAAAIGGSALIGAGAGLYGSNRAANAQASAGREALAFQRQTYDDTQNNMRPFREAGNAAVGRLNAVAGGDMSGFTNSPDYRFRFNEGMGALQNSAAARGGLLSGNTLRAITDFGQGAASTEFGNYWNRNFNTAQLGQTAAAGAGALAANQAGQIGQTIGGIGQANASGIVGGANAITGAVGTGAQNYMLMNALNNRSAYGNSNASALSSVSPFGSGIRGFADGGRPPVGSPSIVGERGPEVFVPDQPGTIVPNEAYQPGDLRRGMVDALQRRAQQQSEFAETPQGQVMGGLSLAMSALPASRGLPRPSPALAAEKGMGAAAPADVLQALKGAGTNREAFEQAFSNVSGLSKEQLREVAAAYDGGVYASSSLTKTDLQEAIRKGFIRNARFQNKIAP